MNPGDKMAVSKLEGSESGFPQALYTHIGVEEDCGDDELKIDGELKKRFAQETSFNEEEPEAKKLKLEEEEVPPAAMVGDSQPRAKTPPVRRCVYEVRNRDNEVVGSFEKRYEAMPAAAELGGYVKAYYYSVGDKEELVHTEAYSCTTVIELNGEICDGKHKTSMCKEYVEPGEKYIPKLKPGYALHCKICGLHADEKGGCCGDYSDDWGIPALMTCMACLEIGDHETRDCTKLHLLRSIRERLKNWSYSDESPPRDYWKEEDILPEWARGLDLGHGLIGDEPVEAKSAFSKAETVGHAELA